MSRWKLFAFKVVFDAEAYAKEEFEEAVFKHNAKMSAIKTQNVTNVEQFYLKKRKQRILAEWLRTRCDRVAREAANTEIADKLANVKRKRMVQRWMLRTDLTKKLRFRWERFHAQYEKRMKFAIIAKLLEKKKINNGMGKAVGNFERFMRTKICQDAFNDIKSFFKSKKLACGVRTKRSTLDSLSFLMLRHEKILRMYFNRYRFAVSNEFQRKRRLIAIFANIQASRRHRGFRRWKEYTLTDVLSQELNETGPVTEEVFEARRCIYNLMDFMRMEGYPEEEVRGTVAQINQLGYD